MDASMRKLIRKLKGLGLVVLLCTMIIVLQCLMGL